MAQNTEKTAFITRTKESHERQMDIIMNLLRENHQLKQVLLEVFRGLSDPYIKPEMIFMYLERIEDSFCKGVSTFD